MATNPWDDPSLANEATKKIKGNSEKIKKFGLPKAKPKPSGITALASPYDQAEQLAKRNRKVDLATRPLRKALPGQD